MSDYTIGSHRIARTCASPSCDENSGLQPPLGFFDDFAFVLLSFLDQQGVVVAEGDGKPCTERTSIQDALEAQDVSQLASFDETPSTLSSSRGEGASLRCLQRLLRRAQEVVEVCGTSGSRTGCEEASLASQSALYLLRLKQMLEEQVHSTEAQRRFGLGSPTATAPTAALAGGVGSLPSSAASRRSTPSRTILHRNGRRYSTTTDASHRPAPSTNDNTFRGKKDFPSDGPTTNLGATGMPGEDAGVVAAACHGQLLFRLQQHLMSGVVFLDKAIEAEAEKHRGLRGILTDALADTLERSFASTLLSTLAEAVAGCGEGEAARVLAREEIADVHARLTRAVSSSLEESTRNGEEVAVDVDGFSAQQRRRSTSRVGVVVHEASAAEGIRSLGLPPFSTEEGSDAPTLGFGVLGCGFPTRVVAQHVWCYESLLRQRFPSFTGTWPRLERMRYFAESQRSPTPTVPCMSAATSTAVSAPTSPPPVNAGATPGDIADAAWGSHDLLHASSNTSVSSFPSTSTWPSPAIRRRYQPAHIGPRAQSAQSTMAAANAPPGAAGSGSNTPTRPPPLVEHTQEKPMAAPAHPDTSSSSARALLREYGNTESPVAEGCDRPASDTAACATELVQRLAPCVLFETFLGRVLDEGAKWHRPKPRGYPSAAAGTPIHGGTSHSASSISSSCTTSTAARQPRTASASPVPLRPLPILNTGGTPLAARLSCVAMAGSPSVAMKSIPTASSSSGSPERSPSCLPGH